MRVSLQEESAVPSVEEVQEQVSGFKDTVMGYVEEHGPDVLLALLTLIIGLWVAKIIRNSVKRVLTGRGVDGTLVGFLSSILYAGLVTMVLISAVGKLGVETTSFVAVLGAAGLAIGFALQGSLGNFASGS